MAKIFIGSKNIPKVPIEKLIRCCSCHKYYDFKDNIFSSGKDNILICPHCGLKHKINFKLFRDKMGNLIKISRLNLTAIDIGIMPTQNGYVSAGDVTGINTGNPANASGKITLVQIYIRTDSTGIEIATFYRPDPDNFPNNFSTRDTEIIGDLAAGLQELEVDLDVQEGDYIGFYYLTGTVYRRMSDCDGYWAASGDRIPCINTHFGFVPNYGYCLYGTGITAGEVKDATGKADIITSLIALLSVSKIKDASGKSRFDTNVDAILHRIISASGKATLETLCDVRIRKRKLFDASGRVTFDTLVEVKVAKRFVFTQATLGIIKSESKMAIKETGSKFDIINVTAKFGIKE